MGAGSSPVSISRIAINNTENISLNRFMFTVAIAFLVMLLFVLWKKQRKFELEKMFLLIILAIGSISIFSMPAHKVGFDEEIHFWRAYFMGDVLMGKEEVEYPSGVEELTTTSLSNWPYQLHKSEEEMKAENAYRNIAGEYKKNNSELDWVKTSDLSGGLYTISYICSWRSEEHTSELQSRI